VKTAVAWGRTDLPAAGEGEGGDTWVWARGARARARGWRRCERMEVGGGGERCLFILGFGLGLSFWPHPTILAQFIPEIYSISQN
jgi:hypothetical protein